MSSFIKSTLLNHPIFFVVHRKISDTHLTWATLLGASGRGRRDLLHRNKQKVRTDAYAMLENINSGQSAGHVSNGLPVLVVLLAAN